jgi:hypothetical protein
MKPTVNYSIELFWEAENDLPQEKKLPSRQMLQEHFHLTAEGILVGRGVVSLRSHHRYALLVSNGCSKIDGFIVAPRESENNI